MSILFATIFFLHIFYECKTDPLLLHPRFYNIQWIATLPPSIDIAADTFTVTQVSLTSSAFKEINTIPTITGLKNPSTILQNTTDSTIAIDRTINVTWDFNNTLTEVDYVRLATNCGATKASAFCNNSKLILTNASTTYTAEAKLTDDVVNIDLHPFANDNDCQHNILILDKKLQSIEKECGFECEQCLEYLHIDLTTNTMNTSYESGYYDVYAHEDQQYEYNNSECDCPSYNLKIMVDNEIEVCNEDNEQAGLFVWSTETRIQMTWTQWMGNSSLGCRQTYFPNTDSFMTVPSWRNITFTYHIIHDTTDIIDDTDGQPTALEQGTFDNRLSHFLNELFNFTWVNSVILTQQPANEYELNITSHDQQMSLGVIQILQMVSNPNISATIVDGIINISAETFDTHPQSIHIEPQWIAYKNKYMDFTWLPHLSDNDECDSYFQTTTPAPQKIDTKNKQTILIITFVVVAVLLFCVIGFLYKHKLACFKHKPGADSEVKGYSKTHSEQMRNKEAPFPFKTQQTVFIKGIKKNESRRLNICEESDDDGVYYGNNYQKVQTSDQFPEDEHMTESKIELALDSARNRVYEFKDFGKELKLDSMIGKGSFAKVWKAKWEAENVAVKIFNSINENSGDEVLTEKEYKEIHAEIYLATSIPPHPNIIRINGFCRKPLCVVMEYMAGGSAMKLVYGQTNRAMPSVTEKIIILVKACFGLAKLTEYKLHHRDIAARNILLGKYDAKIDSDTPVKITDFGMTRMDGGLDDNDNKTKNATGPCKWMAPESIKKKIYNEKTDVYMFGITIWEIMYGREPYEDMDALNAAMNVCMKNERPEFLWDLPLGMKTLIKHCWDKDPTIRPAFKEVAHKLENIQNRVESNIEEIHEMDRNVEEYQRKMNLKKAPSMIVVSDDV